MMYICFKLFSYRIRNFFIRWVFKMKYIFMRNGERITARQIAYVLEKFAERQGMTTKSTHKMRKTYASNLNANGVPLDCIREMLGHSSLSTTFGYI
ncbi:hypothetical protein D7V94_18085 [Parablautia intestinalis]|uniref:Tyr recombinase domain-containing protein n=2 Tax=Parablautia intestinalis TaxID=2320100 RepID=A0A3A9APP7_9FIRM|nr:hypothetical protein D7V94_18085 [Parablautia intestinalis]